MQAKSTQRSFVKLAQIWLSRLAEGIDGFRFRVVYVENRE